jgi:hypothetical protein
LYERLRSRRQRRVVIVVISATVLALFVFLYIAAIAAYHKDTTSRAVLFETKTPVTKDYLDVEVKILSVDLTQENMSLRMDFVPRGSLADKENQLTEGLRVGINSSTGPVERILPKDHYINATDVTLEMLGTVSDYPWDKHLSSLEFFVNTLATDGGPARPVATHTVCFGSLAGLDLDAGLSRDSTKTDILIDLEVQRSAVIKVVVPFSMALIWVLTATVLAMVIAVLIGNKIEMVMFPFIGTILFSMVAFRNALPGAPPIGAISDYLAFFWGYALCVLGLLLLTITWLWRLPRHPVIESKPVTPDDTDAGSKEPEPGRPRGQ